MTDYTSAKLQAAHDKAKQTDIPLNVPDWLLDAAEEVIASGPNSSDDAARDLAVRVMAFIRTMSEEWRRVDTMIPPYRMTTETIDRNTAHQLMQDADERVLLRFVTDHKWVRA